MRIKALVSGFDGRQSYEAGDVLDGNSEHLQLLLYDGRAEPVCDLAQAFARAAAAGRKADPADRVQHCRDLAKQLTGLRVERAARPVVAEDAVNVAVSDQAGS